METRRDEEQPRGKRSLWTWVRLMLPEGRMRVATRRPPRDWFELLTRIPILEQMVIKRFVENLMCERWLEEPNHGLQGMSPTAAAKDERGRALLKTLLTQMASGQEKTRREMRKIRKRLAM
ncbi:MAG: DUF2384 domain-containing protein [Nitrospinae bacterium]|nr:DUF2384 domain-containing protein [Nitrospinota bacterium]